MKLLLMTLLVLTGCATNQLPIKENLGVCKQHHDDFYYFKQKFEVEHAKICPTGDCIYTPEMNRLSDTKDRIAGVYYEIGCDYNYGRIQ